MLIVRPLFILLMGIVTYVPSNEIGSEVYAWATLPVKVGQDRESRKIMEGSSPHFEYLEIHATTQFKGARPGRAHAQKEIEELIIVKEGTMRFTIDDKEKILGKGSLVVVPPLAMQSVENVGDGPLTYYVIMFRSKKPVDLERSREAGGALFINADELEFQETQKGGRVNYFDRPTAMCEHFEIHVTQLNQQGPSHAPHAHEDSEIVLMIEGEAEMTIDEKLYKGTAGDLFFMRSNDHHGVANASNGVCRYFAIRWQ
jgi:quercetin dioxygenase-like cupin family protein